MISICNSCWEEICLTLGLSLPAYRNKILIGEEKVTTTSLSDKSALIKTDEYKKNEIVNCLYMSEYCVALVVD